MTSAFGGQRSIQLSYGCNAWLRGQYCIAVPLAIGGKGLALGRRDNIIFDLNFI